MIPRAAIEAVARRIAARENIAPDAAMAKAERWAKRKAQCAWPEKSCGCERPRCVEIKKPVGARRADVCVAPYLCLCEACRAPAKAADAAYRGASGGW